MGFTTLNKSKPDRAAKEYQDYSIFLPAIDHSYSGGSWSNSFATVTSVGARYQLISTGASDFIVFQYPPLFRLLANKGMKLISVAMMYEVTANALQALTLNIAQVTAPAADGSAPARAAIASTKDNTPAMNELSVGNRLLKYDVDSPAYHITGDNLRVEATFQANAAGNTGVAVYGCIFNFYGKMIDLASDANFAQYFATIPYDWR